MRLRSEKRINCVGVRVRDSMVGRSLKFMDSGSMPSVVA